MYMYVYSLFSNVVNFIMDSESNAFKLPFLCRYYAAPEDENQVHVYNETETGYEESTESNETSHYMEIGDIYEDIENGRDDRHAYEFSHHYIEIKPD